MIEWVLSKIKYHLCAFSGHDDVAAYACNNGIILKVYKCCDALTKTKCNEDHCKCCGKHCNDWKPHQNVGCKCSKCRITRTLHPELWKSKRITFIKIYNSYIKIHGKDIVDKALEGEEYDDIKEDIKKYNILL